MALTIEDFTTPGADTWTCPAGVTVVQVEVIGAGGAGADGLGGGGGGGGAYSRTHYTVTPATVYDLQVGDPAAASGSADRDSWFDSSADVMAKGGANGSGSSGGAGGAAGSGVGVLKTSGGSGGSGNGSDTGGGGGGGAGTAGDGANSSNQSGGNGTSPGNSGGTGGFNFAGSTGNSPGGGGGGAGGTTGGVGGDALVRLTYCTWEPPAPRAAPASEPDTGDEHRPRYHEGMTLDYFPYGQRQAFRPAKPDEQPAARRGWHPATIVPIDRLPWFRRPVAPPPEPDPEPPPAKGRPRWSAAEPDGPDQLPWSRHVVAAADEPEAAPARPTWRLILWAAPEFIGWHRRSAPLEATEISDPSPARWSRALLPLDLLGWQCPARPLPEADANAPTSPPRWSPATIPAGFAETLAWYRPRATEALDEAEAPAPRCWFAALVAPDALAWFVRPTAASDDAQAPAPRSWPMLWGAASTPVALGPFRVVAMQISWAGAVAADIVED